MEALTENDFYDAALGFRITKPASWKFLPPAWSPMAQLRNANPEVDWLQLAKVPFVSFMGHHTSESHVYPTTQVSARPSTVPTAAEAVAVLEQQVAFVESHWDDYQPLHATSDTIIAGHRANHIDGTYRLRAERDGEEFWFEVRARSYTIFTPAYAFTIGMSSSTDARYYDEADFELALRSIAIG